MIDIGNRKMCSDAREWLEQQPNLYYAWRTCPHGWWLTFWLYKAKMDRDRRWEIVREIDDFFDANAGDQPDDEKYKKIIAEAARMVRRHVTYREALALWKAQEPKEDD